MADALVHTFDPSSRFFAILSWASKHHEDFLFSAWHARALSAHLSTKDLLEAHLNMTTELSGPSTHEMSVACLKRFSTHDKLPRSLRRHGLDKSPWQAFFSDFASEFNESQAFEVCSLLANAASAPPKPHWESEIADQGSIHAFFGAARAYPKLCESEILLGAMDRCIRQHLAFSWDEDAQDALIEAARGFFDFAAQHGMPRPSGVENIKFAPLASWAEALAIAPPLHGDRGRPSRI